MFPIGGHTSALSREMSVGLVAFLIKHFYALYCLMKKWTPKIKKKFLTLRDRNHLEWWCLLSQALANLSQGQPASPNFCPEATLSSLSLVWYKKATRFLSSHPFLVQVSALIPEEIPIRTGGSRIWRNYSTSRPELFSEINWLINLTTNNNLFSLALSNPILCSQVRGSLFLDKHVHARNVRSMDSKFSRNWRRGMGANHYPSAAQCLGQKWWFIHLVERQNKGTNRNKWNDAKIVLLLSCTSTW